MATEDHIIHQIASLGYSVTVHPTHVTASGEKYVSEPVIPEQADPLYRAVCRIAEKVGIDLEDG
jgi:hypothetical protein